MKVSRTKWLAIDCFCARRTDAAEMNYSPQVAADIELQKENEKFFLCVNIYFQQTTVLQMVQTVTWGSERGRLTAASNMKHKLWSHTHAHLFCLNSSVGPTVGLCELPSTDLIKFIC